MNWGRLAEDRIAGAIDEGLFDRVEGKGKPVDLSEYFAAPEDLRASNALLKNASVVPPEVDWLKRIRELEHVLDSAKEEDRDRILQELQLLRTNQAIYRERRAARGGR